jgi:hypothetical protein
VPYEQDEVQGISLMKKLLDWDWGMKALYLNGNAVEYLLTRTPKPKVIVDKKWALIVKTIKSDLFTNKKDIVD